MRALRAALVLLVPALAACGTSSPVEPAAAAARASKSPSPPPNDSTYTISSPFYGGGSH